MAEQDNNKMPWLERPSMDKFIHGRERGYRDVHFTGAWKCTLCSCAQYEGGDSPSDLCRHCGHQRHKHEYRT